jgi:hypothetical protein
MVDGEGSSVEFEGERVEIQLWAVRGVERCRSRWECHLSGMGYERYRWVDLPS